MSGMVAGLKDGSSVEDLHKEAVEYETMMLPHLKQEEEECLPLCRAYFLPEEVAPKVQEILADSPKIELGSIIMGMGIQEFRKEFMVQEGIPWFVWYLSFRGNAKFFKREFLKPIDSLKAGK
jgi:hypothetical protein